MAKNELHQEPLSLEDSDTNREDFDFKVNAVVVYSGAKTNLMVGATTRNTRSIQSLAQNIDQHFDL